MSSPAGNGGYVVTQYGPSNNYGALKLNQTREERKWPTFGHPKALGFTQIFLGGAQICLSVILCAAFRLSHRISIWLGIPFWSPVFFVISGVLSISVQNKINHRLIRATLAMNIISSIFAGCGIITYSLDLHYYFWNETCRLHPFKCGSTTLTDLKAHWGITLVLLLLSLVELGIAVATSAFGCITDCHCPPCYDGPQPMIIIQSGPAQDAVIPLAPMTGMPVAEVPLPQQLPMMVPSTYPHQAPSEAGVPYNVEPSRYPQMQY